MRLAFMSVLEIVSNLYGNLPWGNLLQSLLVCLTLKPPVGKTVWTSPEFWNVLKELEKRVASSLPQAWPTETGSASLLSVSLPCCLCICISNSRYIPDVIIPTFHCIWKILFMQSPNVLWLTHHHQLLLRKPTKLLFVSLFPSLHVSSLLAGPIIFP